MGFIYQLLFPSGKSYVGQTIKKKVEARWRAHKTNSRFLKGSCRAVNAAIRKYGWKNVTKKVLAIVPDEEIDDAEVKFIAKFNSYHNGYNLTVGGDVNPMSKNGPLTEYHKQRLKETGHAARTSKTIRACHKDPEWRKAWHDNHKSSHQTQEHRDGQSERSKKMWAAEKAAGKDRGKAISAALNDPVYKAKRAEKRANDPKEKARVAKIKATYAARKLAQDHSTPPPANDSDWDSEDDYDW